MGFNKLKEVIKFDSPSFFLLILPYLIFNWSDLFNSPFFDFYKLSLLLVSLVSFDLILRLGLIRFKKPYLSKFIVFFVTLFFYGYYFILFIQENLNFYLDIFVRGRFILVVLIIFLILLLAKKKTKNYEIINIYLLVFSLINALIVVFEMGEEVSNDINYLKSSNQIITLKSKTNKPVILIITDEYSSPVELYKSVKDSALFEFSNYLKNTGWIVRNNFTSNEISTIHSISSLFNYNLSNINNYSNTNVFDIGPKKLMKAALYDSLVKKEVNIANYGIFHLGNSTPYSDLFIYPKDFLSQFLDKSIYYYVKLNVESGNLKGFSKVSYPMEPHNRFILDKMKDSLQSFKNNKLFVYAHLYMPHGPMRYYSEFSCQANSDFICYVQYWKFTNAKMLNLLKDLVKNDKFRIILSGDHGFRGFKTINPKNTFIAFYGFDDQDLTMIKSVQDLGILINSSF